MRLLQDIVDIYILMNSLAHQFVNFHVSNILLIYK